MPQYSPDDVVEYKNFFSDIDHEAIQRELNNGLWAWGHKSDMSKANQIPMWLMSLSKYKFFNEYLLNKIESKTGLQFNFERVYANGHTFGMKGYPHQDSQNHCGRMLLDHPMNDWNVEWGGKTCFKFPTDDGIKHHFVIPEPNKAIIFPGIIPHWAEETSRIFTGLRISVAWKLELK